MSTAIQAHELSDQTIVDYLRRRPAATIGDLVQFTGVTATAVRQRLSRLMEKGWVERNSTAAGRGRPMHRYSLTSAGVRSGGTNYDLLAQVLWDEVRQIKDREVRQGLLQRISDRLADLYRERMNGETLRERMAELVELMGEHNLPFELEGSTELPVLTALACPYPGLAEQDRGVCAMEKMLISSVLGKGMKLSACRLDGATCCTFETSGAAMT